MLRNNHIKNIAVNALTGKLSVIWHHFFIDIDVLRTTERNNLIAQVISEISRREIISIEICKQHVWIAHRALTSKRINTFID